MKAALAFLAGTAAFAANQPRFVFTADFTMHPSALATDSAGNTYITGQVSGNALKATPGAYQSQNNGGMNCITGTGFGPPQIIRCQNAYLIKLDPTGAVVFATYLGGLAQPQPNAIAVDAQQNVYISGNILGYLLPPNDPGFPVTDNAAFTSGAAFITKLSADGAILEYSTVIPACNLSGLAIDASGNAYFTGAATTDQFPTTAGAYQAVYPVIAGSSSGTRMIVGKLNASGSALSFATYVADTRGFSSGSGIGLDADGNVLAAGTNGGLTGAYGDTRAYVAKLNPWGSMLLGENVFGSAFVDGMKMSASGDIYIACGGAWTDFPVMGNGFGAVPPESPSDRNFLLHARAADLSLVSSVYLPFGIGTGGYLGALDVDSAGNVYVAGTAISGALAATPGAFQVEYAGGSADLVLTKITPDSEIAGLTYMGGSGSDSATSIAVLPDGSVAVGGETNSNDFPGVARTAAFVANLFPAITIENAASYVANTAAPGEIVSIQGYGLGPEQAGLGGVQVFFDNMPAPVLYAQNRQINAQAPWEIAGRAATEIRIVYQGSEAGRATVRVVAAQPGIFYIVNSDGFLNSPSNPASLGDFVSVYATGSGEMDSPGATGGIWPIAPLSRVVQPVAAAVGTQPAEVIYAGSAPTAGSGVFQVNVQIPMDLGAFKKGLQITVGGVTSAPVPIAIR